MVEQSMQVRWEAAHTEPRFRPAYPHEQVVRWTFRNFPPPQRHSMRFLDLGCGAGRHAIFFAQEGFQTSACDLSSIGVRELLAKAGNLGLPIEAWQTPASDLSRCDTQSFDAVCCFAVLYYMTLAEAQAALREVLRVLKPGGKFICVTRTADDSRRPPSQPVSPATWHVGELATGAPSGVEVGMNMLFFSREEIMVLFSEFSDVCIDRMSYVHHEFVDDDWVISACKPLE
jgi:SAM-dependent methyltransferase